MSTNPRDQMVAWWNDYGDQLVFVETPGNAVLAAVRYDPQKGLPPWYVRLCDGATGRFTDRERAMRWGEEKGLAFTEATRHGVTVNGSDQRSH